MTLPGLPYMHAAGDGGVRTRTQVVIIHATDNTASAEDEAGYATHRPDQTSAHVYVDDDSAVQALRLDHIAYGALWNGNQISVQLELSGRSNQISDATMRQAAPIVAEICRRYGIPIRKVTAAQVRAGQKGICGHADITAAFPQDGGDHTDPGAQFPWARFIDYVADGGEDQEDDDMPTRTSLGIKAAVSLPWDRETTVLWDREATDPLHQHADGRYPGLVAARGAYVDVDVYLTVEGMARHDGYQVVLVNHPWDAKANKPAAGTSREVIADAEATTGAQYIRCGGSLYLDRAHHLYVAVTAFRLASKDTAPAPRITAGAWRIRQDA